MRILVTGSTGFVGRNVIPMLLEHGHEVRAAHRSGSVPAGSESFLHRDLVDVDWSPALAGVDAVVHLAGQAHAREDLGDAHYDRVNREGTRRLADAAARAGCTRFVFVSSIRAQIGAVATNVLTERDEPRPTDAYGRSKLAGERAVLAAGLPAVVLRPVLVYGPQVKGNLGTLVRIARTPVPLPLATLDNRRSVLSVTNLGLAIEHVLASTQCVGQTYVVADPEPVTIPDIIRSLRAAANRAAWLVPFPTSALRAIVRVTLGPHAWNRIAGELVVDPSKLIEAGWVPKHDAHTALGALVEARAGVHADV